jgi:23S rRNA G2445 N2-methylase RlmL
MKCAIVCDVGCESILAKDISRFQVKEISSGSGLIFFESDYQTLVRISYSFQGAIKVLAHVQTFSVYSISQLFSEVDVSSVASVMQSLSKGPFGVSCVREGVHDFTSVDIAQEFARKLTVPKDQKNALLNIFIYVKDTIGCLGIDFTGRNLAKRDYKIFLGASSLRGTIAYSLLKFANVTDSDVLLDPFMGSGMIPIEAALARVKHSPFFFTKEKFAFTHFSLSFDVFELLKSIDLERQASPAEIYAFDGLLKFLKYTQKNAKIADINKDLHISKVAIDWLDTKLPEKCIDKIITDPPGFTERSTKSIVLKLYKDFFNQATYVLKKKGTITLISFENSVEQIVAVAQQFGFVLHRQHEIFEGKQKRVVICFGYA